MPVKGALMEKIVGKCGERVLGGCDNGDKRTIIGQSQIDAVDTVNTGY